MKLKQACYDPAFCRMGFKRFSPLGILYTLVLVLLTLANVNLGNGMNATAVYGIYQLFQWSVILNFAYAFILTALLLGDLYTPRLCYAIHALPVTRGGWFGTQVIQGILSIIPGILISGGLMTASVTRFRILIPLWMGVSILQFLFFFGLALLCGVCAGNRLGLAALYGLTNLFGIVISWARLKIFAPLTYGMYIPDTSILLCPLSTMLNPVFSWETYSSFAYGIEDGPAVFFDSSEIQSIEFFPNGIWLHVLFAALGILAIFFAMKLLNRRKPECAGDLLAFQKTEPVVLALCTLSAGVVFHAASSLFDWNMGYLMLALGLVLGYYGCLMLLKRQVNVFTLKQFLPLGGMGLAILLALSITGLDLFGTTYRIPEAEQIASVELRMPGNSYQDTFITTEAADIENILTLHRDALQEHRVTENARPLLERIFGNEEMYQEYEKADGKLERTGMTFLIYNLKNGSTLFRSYQFHETSPNLEILQNIFSQPRFVFSSFDLDIFSEADISDLLDRTTMVQLTCWHDAQKTGYYQDKITYIPTREEWDGLMEAMLEDAKEGNLAQSGFLHPGADYLDYINIIYPASHYEGMDSLNISLYSDCTHTLNWLIDHGYHGQLPE